MTATPDRLRLGTRRSALALAQSGHVARDLETAHPGLLVELVPIVTRGDRVPGDLGKFGGKGLFTEELEAGLLDGSLDLAVHSLKDLPVRFHEDLVLAAYPQRADARDVLVCEVATSIAGLPPRARVLTSSLRRQAQILALRGDVVVEPIRGNVETRLRKWRHSGAEATILAAAGLARLDITEAPMHPLSVDELLPAPGQGILAVQTRRGTPAERLCAVLDHAPSAAAARAERAVVAAFGGDCSLPLAAWATVGAEGVLLRALLAAVDGQELLRAEALAATPEAAAARCVERLRAAGAAGLLAAIAAGRPVVVAD